MNHTEHYEAAKKRQDHSKSGDSTVNQEPTQGKTTKQDRSDGSLTDLLRGVLSQNYNEKLRYEKHEIL